MSAQPGFQTHVHELGQGPRRALALHCTMAFGGAWGGLARAVDGTVSLLAADLPSHGKSSDWDGVSHLGDTTVASALEVMDAGPMDVIGHSFGGMAALQLAVQHPERVRSLTLIEPVFFAIARQEAPETLDTMYDQEAPFTKAMKAGDREAAARAFNRMWSDQAQPWDSLPEQTRLAMARGVHIVTGSHGLLYDDDRELLQPGALDSLRVPTLILRGEMAHPAIVATNNGLTARIPGSRQDVIAGAGHMAPISHPKETSQIWGSFLQNT